MRRGSVVGPLILIALGALALANTLRPDLPLLEIAARYWPLLLIGWGLLRLVEIVIWAFRGRPLPASGIGAGEWTLIILLSVIGAGVSFAHSRQPWRHLARIEMFGQSFDYAVSAQSHPAKNGCRVVIENMRGNARVAGGDVTEVKASGHKTVRALLEADAEQADRQSPVEISSLGDQVVIRTNQDRVMKDHRVTTNLDISVPRGCAVEARGRHGDFEISDLQGDVTINSDNAGVRLQNIGGNVRLDLRGSDLVRAANVKGTIEVIAARGRDLELENVEGQVTVNASFGGDLLFRNLAKPLRFRDARTDLRVERIPGEIQMDLGDLNVNNVVGPLVFSARSRDVQVDRFADSVQISIDRGDVNLRPAHVPVPKIDVRTRSGDVELALPPDAKFELKAATANGDVTNDFGSSVKSSVSMRGGLLEGAVGRGPVLTLNTDRGSVTLRKDTGEPLVIKPDADGEKRPGRKRIEISAGDGTIHIEKN